MCRIWKRIGGKIMNEKCTLSDKELLEKVSAWVSSLNKTGGKSWTLNVPVDFNSDPDMLISELCSRYNDALSAIDDLALELYQFKDR